MRPFTTLYTMALAVLGFITAACESPRKKLPDVMLHTAPYIQRTTADSVYLSVLLLGADAAITGDTTAVSPGAGRFEIAADPAFKKADVTPWQVAGPDNGYRITGAFAYPGPGSQTYIRCHFGPSRSFIRAGRVESLVIK